MSERTAPALMLLLAVHGANAQNIDTLGRDCGAGREHACAQLASIAATSTEGSSRRTAAERLIKARSRGCSPAAERLAWGRSRPVQLASEYFFEHALDAGRQAEIVKAGDILVAGALRLLGLDTAAAADKDASQAIVGVTVFGAARA